jgi:hypothetical protein
VQSHSGKELLKMSQYTVANKTSQTIWWQDGAWTSGDLLSGDVRTVESNHDADVTMFGKGSSGNRDEWGRVWILLGKTLEVYGDKVWSLK